MRALVVLALFFISTWCSADMHILPRRTFSVAVVCVADADCTGGIRALKNTSAYLEKRVNVKLEVKRLAILSEDFSGGFFSRLYKARQRASDIGRGMDVTLFFTAPYPKGEDIFHFPTEDILGIASGIGVIGKEPCWSLVKTMGSERFLTKIVIHEMGHLLGASHTHAGLMHANASVNQYSDEYSVESLDQIAEHLLSL